MCIIYSIVYIVYYLVHIIYYIIISLYKSIMLLKYGYVDKFIKRFFDISYILQCDVRIRVYWIHYHICIPLHYYIISWIRHANFPRSVEIRNINFQSSVNIIDTCLPRAIQIHWSNLPRSSEIEAKKISTKVFAVFLCPVLQS